MTRPSTSSVVPDPWWRRSSRGHASRHAQSDDVHETHAEGLREPEAGRDSPPLLPRDTRPQGWLRWTWRQLTSMRTAVVLLCLLGLAAIPGSILPQRNVATNPGAVLMFSREHPGAAPWLDRFGLFEVYASPWFAAIYLLLLVSMVGCVLPRCLRLGRAMRAAPAAGPTNLGRLPEHRRVTTSLSAQDALDRIAAALRHRHFRVVAVEGEVRAEKGYARELGNLLFHLSLLVLLVGVAVGRLFGFEGRVAVAEGNAFSNVASQYDEFNSRPLTDITGLEPFSFVLNDFRVAFETRGPQRGAPREFEADVTARTASSARGAEVHIEPNHPLDVGGTKVFLTGQGYAPRVTVRDGRGNEVFSGPVIFLPRDGTYASDGVVKAPDARPTQLAFEGVFLPTAAMGANGPYSAFPDALNPRLLVNAYVGDLGLSSGIPQSVYVLDKTRLRQVETKGRPLTKALAVGQTMRLPHGKGSLTFDGVTRFANFQIAYDPGKSISLVAAALLLVGVTMSLLLRRRRMWVRVTPGDPSAPGAVIEAGVLPLTRRGAVDGEIDSVLDVLDDDRANERTAPAGVVSTRKE